METTGNCTIAIGATHEARQQANSIISTMYEGCFSRPVVVQHLLMPHVRHLYVLLPLVIPHIRDAHLGLHKGVRLKGRTIEIWFFGCNFACAAKIRCGGLKLSFGTIIFFGVLIIIKKRPVIKGFSSSFGSIDNLSIYF